MGKTLGFHKLNQIRTAFHEIRRIDVKHVSGFVIRENKLPAQILGKIYFLTKRVGNPLGRRGEVCVCAHDQDAQFGIIA